MTEERKRASYNNYMSRTERANDVMEVQNEELRVEMEGVKQEILYFDVLRGMRVDFLRMKAVIKSLIEKLSGFDSMELCPTDQKILKYLPGYQKPLVELAMKARFMYTSCAIWPKRRGEYMELKEGSSKRASTV